MSHSASPRQTPAVADPDALVDLFADVSQHGSSLFEFFSLPSSSLDHGPFGGTIGGAYHSVDNELLLNQPAVSITSPSHVSPAPTKKTGKPARAASKSPHKVPAPRPPHTPISKRSRKQPTLPLTAASSAPALAPAPAPVPAPVPVAAVSREDDSSSNGSQGSKELLSKPLSSDDRTRRRVVVSSHDAQPMHTIPSSSATPSSSRPPAPPASTATLTGSGTVTVTVSNSNGDSSAALPGEGPPRHTHNSHTRRCRAKVNSKFQELLAILPAPPADTGIKHKAQILDYTIRVFRDIHARKTMLEAELALSSRIRLHSWVQSTVSRSMSFHDMLTSYLTLICTKCNWKYAEAWVCSNDSPPPRPSSEAPDVDNVSAQPCTTEAVEDTSGAANLNLIKGPNSRLRLGVAVIPSLGNTDDPDLRTKLERFRDKSRPYGCKPRVDLPGRILCTMRPEWLPLFQDTDAFQRVHLAHDASLTMCFGVPMFVRGYVVAVAMFYDTEPRAYDPKSVDLAEHVALLLGTSFGNVLDSAARSGIQRVAALS